MMRTDGTLSHEGISGGYAIFGGPHKLAVVTNSDHRGLYRNGVGIQEPLATEAWMIHWTDPHMPVVLAKAVADYVLGLPPCPPPG